MEKDAMGGHVMLPLESLSLDLPNGGIVLGHDKDVSTLQDEISGMRSRQGHLNRRRREALDKLIDLKGSIRVFCRVRPSISTSNLKTKSPVTIEQEKIAVRAVGGKKDFSVDRVFDQESTQGSFFILLHCLSTAHLIKLYNSLRSCVHDTDDVFHEVKPILRSALDGHNVCILAFGQTGTGKTYTMVSWCLL